MQNIFTLEELQQIKKNYEIEEDILICHCDYLFRAKWNEYFESREIKDFGRKFLETYPKWEELFFIGDVVLFVANKYAMDKAIRKQIRIEFLDWLIENTES